MADLSLFLFHRLLAPFGSLFDLWVATLLYGFFG